MIISRDQSAGVWVGSGMGPLRPIVVEGEGIAEVMLAFGDAIEAQAGEDYAMTAALERQTLEAQEPDEGDMG